VIEVDVLIVDWLIYVAFVGNLTSPIFQASGSSHLQCRWVCTHRLGGT
jgi:hypothetical protein